MKMTMLEIGNWMMVLCAVFYLAWWRITFRPPAPEGTPLGRACLALAFLTGLAGIALAIVSMNGDYGDTMKAGISGIAIVIGGAVTYGILLAVSSRLFHRQVTSELMIIIVWTVLELCALNYWYRHGKLFQFSSIILACLVILVAIASLVCYLQYYQVPYEKGYLIGSIPLVLTAVIMLIINIVVLFEAVAVRGQIMDGDGMVRIQETNTAVIEQDDQTENTDPTAITVIRVGDSFFSIDLAGNSSSEAFYEKLRSGDLKLEMHDYGGFEKVGDLPWELPVNDEEITTQPGDLILYQGNKITVYYGENTWNFTRLGRLNGTPEEILEAFGGPEDITAEFFLEWTE